ARQDPRGRAGRVHRGARGRRPAPSTRDGMTLRGALSAASARLAEAGIDSARLEAELLLARACDDCARALLYAELDRELTPEQIAAFEGNIARREQREPLAYVLGEWGFRRLTLKTDRRALIQPPETPAVVA